MSIFTKPIWKRVTVGWAFFRTFFTDRELLIFTNLDLMVGLSLSAGVRKLASQLSLPESTCKSVLRKFRDANIIVAGNKQSQGIRISPTSLGKLLSEQKAYI